MKLSKAQITLLWTKLAKKLAHNKFPPTIISNDVKCKSAILALFAKNGDKVNQLEQIGFVICQASNFIAHTDNISSDYGIITNEYFTGEVIDVNNTIIPQVYIHLVRVISGPIVINNISLHLIINETFHQYLLNNIAATQLLKVILQAQINDKLVATTNISSKQFSLVINNGHWTKKKILHCETKINLLLQQKLTLTQLLSLIKTNKEYHYLHSLTEQELNTIINIDKFAIINIKSSKSSCEVVATTGKEQIDKIFSELKKPLLKALTILNKKIKMINNFDVMRAVTIPSQITTYEQLLLLQKTYKKLDHNFTKWRLSAPEILANLAKNFAFSYYSEMIDNIKIAHYSYNNELLDNDLMVIKGQELLNNVTNTILFLSNNISESPSMIILLSNDIHAKYDIKDLFARVIKNAHVKITVKNDMINVNAEYYQDITDFISAIIIFLKSEMFKLHW